MIISPAEPKENTLFLLESLGGTLSREPINEYIRNNPPDKALIEKELIREYENSKISKEKLRESFLNNTGAGAWYLCSLFILIWGIIFKKAEFTIFPPQYVLLWDCAAAYIKETPVYKKSAAYAIILYIYGGTALEKKRA